MHIHNSIAERPRRQPKSAGGIKDNKTPSPQPSQTIVQKEISTIRVVLVCIVAASVGFPIAVIGIAKALMLLGLIAMFLFSRKAISATFRRERLGAAQIAILFVLASFAISLAWTSAPASDAFGSLNKYGKLLLIPFVVILVQSRKEATYALWAFAAAQLFVIVSSWMLFFHFPVTWATSPWTVRDTNAVFSSYLDQGIMAAVFAALCWHFRAWIPGKFGRHFAIAVMLIALVNVFFVLRGRTGHVVAIALVSLAIMWEMPRRFRPGVFLIPLLLVFAISAASPKVRDRIMDVKTEVQSFSFRDGASVVSGTSSGIRLHFWHRAVQSIAQHPLLGAGIGSWSGEFNRLEKQNSPAPESVAPMGNPHQEYLLWGVQLGISGIFLLIGFFLAIFRDTRRMDVTAARATQSLLVALAIACLFNSVIYDALIGDFFCVTLGLLLALGSHTPDDVGDKLFDNSQQAKT